MSAVHLPNFFNINFSFFRKRGHYRRYNRGYRRLCVRNVIVLVEGDPFISMQYVFIRICRCICVRTLCAVQNTKICFICYCWTTNVVGQLCAGLIGEGDDGGLYSLRHMLVEILNEVMQRKRKFVFALLRFSLKCANFLLPHQLQWMTTTKTTTWIKNTYALNPCQNQLKTAKEDWRNKISCSTALCHYCSCFCFC